MTTRVEPTDAEIEDWIEGATFVQVKVDIHRNPALWADLQPLYRLIDAAETRLDEARAGTQRRDDDATLTGTDPGTPPAGEHTLGESNRIPASVEAAQHDLDELVAQAETLYAAYDADKETWTLRGLEQAELRSIVAAHERPPLQPPARRAGEKADRFKARTVEYIDQVADYKLAVDEHALSVSVVEVVVRGERKPPPSIDGLRRLRERPHGLRHWAQLVEAMESVTLSEVAIPAPHRSSARA
jgi:hypothetical protein